MDERQGAAIPGTLLHDALEQGNYEAARISKLKWNTARRRPGAPGKVSPALIVGFGLHWAWVYLFMFSGQYILFPEADSMQLLLSATSGVFHAVALLLYRRVSETGPGQLLRTRRRTSAATVRSRRFWCGATLLCMAGNMVSVGPLAAALFVLAGVAERRGIGHAAHELRCLLQRVRPAHHCAVRGAFHGGERAGVRPHPRRERGFCAGRRPSMSGSAIPRVALPEQMLRRSGGQAGVRLPDDARAHRLLRSALGVPSIIFGVLLALRCCALTGALLDVLLSESSAENTFAFSTILRRACSLVRPSSWPCSRCASRATSPSACSCRSSPYCS